MATTINTLAIIQARMSSTRLPSKVLKLLAGKPVLEHVVSRVQQSKYVDKVSVATSVDESDNLIQSWCEENKINCYRGSLNDVLDRFYQAAKIYNAKNILRITADCPAIDYTILDEVIERQQQGDYDYYGLKGDFPDGLDCTVISYKALSKAWMNAELDSEREHVGPYIEKHPELFKLGGYEKFKNLSHLRWTLDESNDYDFLKIIFDELYKINNYFGHELILELLKEKPNLNKINNQIIRNDGYLNSIKNDKIIK